MRFTQKLLLVVTWLVILTLGHATDVPQVKAEQYECGQYVGTEDLNLESKCNCANGNWNQFRYRERIRGTEYFEITNALCCGSTSMCCSSLEFGQKCFDEEDAVDSDIVYSICKQIDISKPEYSFCMNCFDKKGIWTAVGCIPTESPTGIIQVIITIGLGLSGGVVLIMILVGSAMLSVSQGDPNKTKEAQEIITAAIIGLIFVIFSITILQFIGVSILKIPGFGE